MQRGITASQHHSCSSAQEMTVPSRSGLLQLQRWDQQRIVQENESWTAPWCWQSLWPFVRQWLGCFLSQWWVAWYNWYKYHGFLRTWGFDWYLPRWCPTFLICYPMPHTSVCLSPVAHPRICQRRRGWPWSSPWVSWILPPVATPSSRGCAATWPRHTGVLRSSTSGCWERWMDGKSKFRTLFNDRKWKPTIIHRISSNCSGKIGPKPTHH